MIGDKYETDIEMAIKGNLDSVLVMSGETKENNLEDIKSKIVDYTKNNNFNICNNISM